MQTRTALCGHKDQRGVCHNEHQLCRPSGTPDGACCGGGGYNGVAPPELCCCGLALARRGIEEIAKDASDRLGPLGIGG